MRLLLVGPELEENLSLRYLASSLRAAGHQPVIAAFDTLADTPAVVAAAAHVDAVGLSMCYQVRAPEFLALAAQLKQARPECPVLAGGHYASCAADELLARHNQIDLVVIHESEQTLVELAALPVWSPQALVKLPGVVFRDGGVVRRASPRVALTDLDLLPWPERSGPARLMAGVPTAYMMGSRGCLSACDYCCISTMHRMVSGARFRQRSPQDIVAEMAWLYHERGIRQFIFHDDNFLVPDVERNLERIEAIDRGMRREGVRHVALALKCRPGDVDRGVFLRLRDMGLLRVFLGIESGSRTGLASIGRRQTVEQEDRALDLCAELGISTQYTIILFHPEATLASMREDLAFVGRHAGQPLSFCRAEIYTGTPLERRMLREGRAFGNYLAREYDYSDSRTLHAWTAARTLLAERCFAPHHLLGQIVRLDHQAAILRHFYEGRDVDALVADFAAFEQVANRDSVAVMEELFDLCEAYPDAKAAGFKSSFAELQARERLCCHALVTRACAFREAIAARSLGVLGLAGGTRAPAADRGFLERLPQHAAAVFLAVGLLNCNSEGGAKSLSDGSPDSPVADTKAPAETYKDQMGMFEAPPPPMDAPLEVGRDSSVPDSSVADTGVSEAGARDAGASEAGVTDLKPKGDVVFLDQMGMFEAPPPPLDAPLKKD
jgi:anaerobic magnesium-protoporphyrin IX monomethyl ester cyclase